MRIFILDKDKITEVDLDTQPTIVALSRDDIKLLKKSFRKTRRERTNIHLEPIIPRIYEPEAIDNFIIDIVDIVLEEGC